MYYIIDPLKVDKLYPVVGKDYVVLYWDVQNFVNSNCRFRLRYYTFSNCLQVKSKKKRWRSQKCLIAVQNLHIFSYTGTSNSGHQSSETVELNNTSKYRFDGLESETYYTFTITVIMGVGDAKAESESEMVTVGISGAGW